MPCSNKLTMRRISLFVPLLFLLWAATAFGLPFNQFVVFGDSLSDTGNLYALTGGALPAPPAYTAGRFTNGPDTSPATSAAGVWHEQLATQLGIAAAQPAVMGGQNYAVGGAETGGGGTVGMGTQVTGFLTTHPTVSSNSLYVVWGGANDLYNAADPVAAAQSALINLTAEITALSDAGAKYFLWANLPSLDQTPRGAGSSELQAASALFNTGWAQAIALLQGQNPGIQIVGLDVNSLFASILGNPGAYGLSNITGSAQGQPVDPDTYLFWDDQHPTTVGHHALADFAHQEIEAAFVPEPASIVLVLTGIGGVFVLRKRRKLL